MTTLDQLRRLVRQQTETTEAELPDITVDDYLSQAFNRTVNGENDWPFLESSWLLTQPAGTSEMALPSSATPQGIRSIIDEDGYRLRMIDNEEAEDLWLTRAENVT